MNFENEKSKYPSQRSIVEYKQLIENRKAISKNK